MKSDTTQNNIGAVVIGRNEGDRLKTCLTSLLNSLSQIVYVDSGSTDGSVDFAISKGVITIALDTKVPFTAARARNEGWKALLANFPTIQYIQFVDGDCEVQPNWINHAASFLNANSEYAAVCGRRRERYPGNSIYNSFCDIEWNTPIGDTLACGGDAMIRASVLVDVKGYRPDLIAGEEPELCVRFRQHGWKIRRLDCEMTLHDANMLKFSQWWLRAKRGGYAYAAGSFIHKDAPEGFWKRETKRAFFWGVMLPTFILIAALFAPALAILISFAYIALFGKIVLRGASEKQAIFLVLAKFAEGVGVMQFHYRRIFGRSHTLIEYK